MTARALSGGLKHRDENMSRSHPEGFTIGDSPPGIVDVHSGAEGVSLDGTPYSDW
jgi:hypothetical protein